MKRAAWLTAVVLAAVMPAVEAGGKAAAAREIEVSQCLVSLVDEAKVPAQEAGVLVELAVTEGTQVSREDVIGRVNDDQPNLEKQRAKKEHAQAMLKAENDVNLRFAIEAEKFAKKDHDRKKSGFEKGIVVEEDCDKALFEWQKTKAQIEQAKLEQQLAMLDVAVKQAEVDAADAAISRRLIRAPLDGVVVDVLKHRGEWVQPGEAIARVIRTDQLLVKGHVPISEAPQSLVEGRPVRVTVELDRGRKESFSGHIVFASPEVNGGAFLVHADVENRQVDGKWLLPAGVTGMMTIRLGQPAEPPASR